VNKVPLHLTKAKLPSDSRCWACSVQPAEPPALASLFCLRVNSRAGKWNIPQDSSCF